MSSNHHGWGGCCHIDQIGKMVKLLLHHKQQDIELQTSMNKGRVNDPSMGIELATSGELAVALANWAMVNFDEMSKISVYIRT